MTARTCYACTRDAPVDAPCPYCNDGPDPPHAIGRRLSACCKAPVRTAGDVNHNYTCRECEQVCHLEDDDE